MKICMIEAEPVTLQSISEPKTLSDAVRVRFASDHFATRANALFERLAA